MTHALAVPQSSAALPFRLAGGANPLLLLPVSVNAAPPEPFVLDTGAGLTLVTPELANRLGLAATEVKEGRGAAGTVRVALARARSIDICGVMLEDVTVGITDDLHRIGAAIGTHVAGALGYNALCGHRLTVDYPRRLVRLDPTAPAPSGYAVPFVLAHPHKPLVVVQGMINSRGPYALAVDTGASVTVLGSTVARDLGLSDTPVDAMTGGGGQVAAAAAAVERLQIGSVAVGSLSVAVAPFVEELSRAIGTTLHAIVGFNFLRHFEVRIDYPAQRIEFRSSSGR